MALKVMLSSVRRGLADVRDAVAPVIKILRYEVVRFETVAKAPVPPRATCVEMVENSDIYLLILGDDYGETMPGTNLAPTEEEWRVARNLGKPTVVFKREGIKPDPRQAAFIQRVEDYETGVWRYTFAGVGDLISQLEEALATASEALRPAGPTPLSEAVVVPWLQSTNRGFSSGGTVLETHLAPVEAATEIPAAALGDLRRTLASAGQEFGPFELGQAIEFAVAEDGVVARASRDGRRPEAGIRVGRRRVVSVWEALPTTSMLGTVLDRGQLVSRVARDLRLAVSLGVIQSERVAIALGLGDISMLGIPTEFGTGMSLPFASSGRNEIHLDPADSWSLRSLSTGAEGISLELVARLLLRLGRP